MCDLCVKPRTIGCHCIFLFISTMQINSQPFSLTDCFLHTSYSSLSELLFLHFSRFCCEYKHPNSIYLYCLLLPCQLINSTRFFRLHSLPHFYKKKIIVVSFSPSLPRIHVHLFPSLYLFVQLTFVYASDFNNWFEFQVELFLVLYYFVFCLLRNITILQSCIETNCLNYYDIHYLFWPVLVHLPDKNRIQWVK